MGIFFVILAALLASMSNLCMRRSIDAGGSSKAYLVVQMTFSFFAMILLNPVRTGDYAWNGTAVSVGLVGGISLGLLMWGIGKTLEKGPPGLSLAVLNSSSVMPAIVLALVFGAAFGHPYTLSNGIGSAAVVFGLLWAGKTADDHPGKASWAFFAFFIFLMHTIFLVFLAWWAMVLSPGLPRTSLIPFRVTAQNLQWFMPAVLLVGALFQWAIFLFQRQSMPKGAEITYGILGGVAHGACTFFLILAPQVALQWENAMIFPIFSVGVILVCNTWAQILYKERVNWWANGLCTVGILIGTIAWTAL